jgi:CPA1 family monovalent cation:H+ antiporter
MDEIVLTETIVIELLLIVTLVAIGTRRLRVPYTVALVLVGPIAALVLGLQGIGVIDLTPELILALFVPPLVFEAAFHIDFDKLRDYLVPILVLAVPGVLLTTFIVGFIVSVGVSLPLPVALVFGALIAATDPVAVIALFRTLGAPKPLALLVEGESLFNDGTAIVVFRLTLGAAAGVAATAGAGGVPFNLLNAIVEFGVVSLGGLAVGSVLGWVVSQLIARVDDYLIEITLTTVLAFGAYLVAERFNFSGVLAVVAAGLINGNVGPRGMSPTTRIVLFNFWEYLAFVANSLLFLFIGLEVNIPDLVASLGPIAVAVAAVVISRALAVYVLTWLVGVRGRKVPVPYRHVLFWGGLRGAISLALALSLPASLGERNLLINLTFGVLLFTLLGQGTTIEFLMSRLKLVARNEEKLEYERRHARLVAARAARDRLHRMHQSGLISVASWQRLAVELDEQIRERLESQSALLSEKPELQAEEIAGARREGLRAQRAALAGLLRDGLISDHVFEELVVDVDAALEGAPVSVASADGEQPVV